MCLLCQCAHCKDGECDGHHHAHDWVRKVRDEGFPSGIAIIAMMNDEKWSEDQARIYLEEKQGWVKPLLPWLKDDQGGTV
jgi:hypothetical protein